MALQLVRRLRGLLWVRPSMMSRAMCYVGAKRLRCRVEVGGGNAAPAGR